MNYFGISARFPLLPFCTPVSQISFYVLFYFILFFEEIRKEDALSSFGLDAFFHIILGTGSLIK